MNYRTLGQCGIELSILGFGASSLGAEFRDIDIAAAMRCVPVALEGGVNLIDTSPYYGRGQSEVLLGYALDGVPRDSFYLSTKLGRYTPERFDFSAARVVESVETSLHRMRTDYLDIVLCHDVEFVDLTQIVQETLPALQQLRQRGLVRWIGISGYPMKIFRQIASQSELDVVLSYNHYTLQNDMLASQIEFFQSRGIGIMNAAPFSARLLTDAPLPPWHKATEQVRVVCRRAAEHCRAAGADLAQLALQFSVARPELTTCIAGSANPQRVAQWLQWIQQPPDPALMGEIQKILQPVHNWFYTEGRPENNDTLGDWYSGDAE